MPRPFDPGYGSEPFRGLCESYPEQSVYPQGKFRTEWGPVFHRGRLDGSARLLVIGQDPAQHETIAGRILVGEAGHRVQGLLAKLGIDRSYVMVNTFLYSLYGKGGAPFVEATGIARYRNRWLSAIFDGGRIDAVVALGDFADRSWQTWKRTSDGKKVNPRYAKIWHPTRPEASRDPAGHAAAIRKLLDNWNREGLQKLHPLPHPDKSVPLKLYGNSFGPGDKVPIPAVDLPAGTPEWMAIDDGWADRPPGPKKRATITVVVPRNYLP